MVRKRLLGSLSLIVAAVFWGSTFVAQDAASELVDPFTFLASRSLLGFLFLAAVCLVKDGISKRRGTYKKPDKAGVKALLIGGICCGIALTIASGLQQFGMTGDNSGKAGFITAMYILLVPIFGLFFGKRVSPVIWCCVAMGIVGLCFLCLKGGFGLEISDIFLMICAAAFAVHIMVVDRFSPSVDAVKLSCLQFFVAFVLSTILALIFERNSLSDVLGAWLPIAYAGILSSGIAFTLQIIGQKHTDPTVASLLMSLESVFAVIATILVRRQFPSVNEYIGSVIMFAAIIISQLPIGVKKN